MDLKINYDGCLPDEKKKVMYLLIQASTSKPHPVLSLLSAVWAWIPGKYALYLIRVIGSSCGLYLNWNKCWNTCRARRLLTGHLQSCLVAGVFHASRCLPVIPNRHHLKIAKWVRDVSWNQIKEMPHSMIALNVPGGKMTTGSYANYVLSLRDQVNNC